MNSNRLSVVLATHNEESVLDKTLSAIKDIAWEIIIVDGESTDKTLEIAKKYSAKITSTTNKPNFHINKNIAISQAKGDWVLQLDADEVVSPELSHEIIHTINDKNAKNGYWLNRKNWFLNRFLSKGGQYPDPTLRLYKNGLGRLPQKDVHEQAVVDPPVGHLRSDLLHYRDTSFSKYLNGFNRYSSFQALQLKAAGQSINFFQTFKFLFYKPSYIFLNIYIRHRGYVDGYAGFIFALFSAFIPAVAYMKLWQPTK